MSAEQYREYAWRAFQAALVGWENLSQAGDSFSSVSTRRAFEAGWDARGRTLPLDSTPPLPYVGPV